jgi:peroxiredoxin
LLAALSILTAPIHAQRPSAPSGPAAAWQRVIALDAGPQVRFTSREDAKAGALAHQARQEKALRDFIATYPRDEHGFEAQLRLARLLQIKATMGVSGTAREEARKILDELYLTANSAQRAEVDFARLAFSMRQLKPYDGREREQLLTAVMRFKAEYPKDRRLGALLAEVAGLFDRDPEQKRSLLAQAQAIATDAALKGRIADDLKRLDWLGKPITLKMPARGGKPLDLADYRGKVIVLVFLAEFSPPAAEAVAALKRAVGELPKGSTQIIGVSLDSKPDELATLIRRENIDWPIGFDGKGWASPGVRAFGINRLPTVWLLDKTGTLRSLNGLGDTADQVKQLLLRK